MTNLFENIHDARPGAGRPIRVLRYRWSGMERPMSRVVPRRPRRVRIRTQRPGEWTRGRTARAPQARRAAAAPKRASPVVMAGLITACGVLYLPSIGALLSLYGLQ